MKMLGVLLCYNNGDFLEDAIRYLLEQNHDLIVWDPGSTDETPPIIRQYKGEMLEARYVPGSFDFYELYPAMSRHLMENYISTYDWVHGLTKMRSWKARPGPGLIGNGSRRSLIHL